MKFCWIDLETTGVKLSERNEIIEVGIIVTEGFFNKVDTFHAVIKPSDQCLWHNDVVAMHSKSGLLNEVLDAQKTFADVSEDILDFISKHGDDKYTLTPAGNNIQFDMKFLTRFEPRIEAALFGRHFDVSSIRVAIMEMFGREQKYKKTYGHRALGDLEETMNELQWYIDNFFKGDTDKFFGN